MKKILAMLFIILSLPVKASQFNIVLAADMSNSHSVLAGIFGDYLVKYLSPEFKVQFRIVPGAGGLNAANYLYNTAPKDGNTIGILYKNIPIIGALNRSDSNIKFDASKFTWLGSLVDGRQDAGILISNIPYTNELLVGSDNSLFANPVDFISRYSRLKLKKIAGYKTPEEIRLAIIRGEINAMATSILGTVTYDKNWLNRYHIIVQFGNGRIRNTLLPNVPTLDEMLVDDEARKALSIMENQFALIRSYVAPPDIPEEKAVQLREAFRLASQDRDFIERAKKISIDITPIYHAEAEKIVNETYTTPTNILDMIR